MKNFYKKYPVIQVRQPLGDFWLCSIDARDLLELSYPDKLTITGIDDRSNSVYKLSGNQRAEIEEKRKQIGRYIDGVEATFPNTVILGANVDENGYPLKDIDERWTVEKEKDSDMYYLYIPVKKKNARVIDGQHRLNGFRMSEKHVSFDMPCAVFLELPLSIQASIFATININQKRVDRSLAFELFGYDLNEEPMESWSPEKLGIFITRKLNVDDESPLKGHIKVVANYSRQLFDEQGWIVATSVFVDGVMALISSDPKKDRDLLNRVHLTDRNRKGILSMDSSPLRQFYLESNDLVIYTIVLNYFKAVDNVFSMDRNAGYINKTVGIQGLFDLLKTIVKKAIAEGDVSYDFFRELLLPAGKIDFNDLFFQASGIGRSRIKNILLLATGEQDIQKIKEKDRPFYENLLALRKTIPDQEKWIWEDEAELDILRILENTEWHYRSKLVTFEYGPNNEEFEFSSYDAFFGKLVEIAEETAAAYAPGEADMREQLMQGFSPEQLVEDCLDNYKDQLRQMGWWRQLDLF